jgi:GAF domain
MATRGVPVRFAVWLFHLALPLLGLWLLLAVPSTDLLVEHHPTHFWLVALVAGVNVGLALVVDRAAQRHEDPRLLLVGLGFLAAALFFVLHALATPGVLLDSRNGGFALATPVGLALGALFTAASAVEFSPERAQRVLRIGPWLRSGVYTLAAVWGIFSLAGLPPLRDPAIAERLSGPLIAMTAVSVVLYVFVAVRFYLLYRRRRSVMLLSIITANILLAESMIAVALSVNWRLTWWLWHVLMVLAFGYVAYSAYIGYRREGATTGLFDGVRTEETVRAVRAEYEAALETLVGALRRQEAGEISADEMSLITAGMESRFGLTEGQTAVLGRAADALRTEREQIGRLDTLVAIGHESRVRLAEQDLLQRAVRRVADGFGGDGVRVGLLGGGHLRFPDELATDPSWLVGADVAQRVEASVGERGGMEPVTLDEAILACPLTVKDKPAGVLLTRRRNGFSERDRSLFASLASQLSMGMENARLYHQLDGLFRVYMSPDVATALLADPEQAALGGAVVEVTALFADLRGFTGFSERSTPEEIVVMLNQY